MGTVEVFNGSTSLGLATVSAGTWSLDTNLAAGSYSNLNVVATDKAGNSSTIANAQTIIVDATSSSLSTRALSLAAGSDTGTSDNITYINTPIVTVSTLNGIAMSVGDIIKIIDTSNGNAVVGSYTVVSGDLTGGAWNGTTKNITASRLADGVHNLKVELVDLAGNVGRASTAALGVTIIPRRRRLL